LLQVDNCGRENKNWAMIAFCAWLVELGLFKLVQLSFLPVGHTHANVDVPFGLVKKYLAKHNIVTMDEFLKALPKMLKKTTTMFENWEYRPVPKV
jgi:hypothetical protein